MSEQDNNKKKHLYIFLDEGGNFDFSDSGTKYFTLTAITKIRPFNLVPSLVSCKYDLLEAGHDVEFFHASEDIQVIRDEVFKTIVSQIEHIRIDSIVVEKSKTGPALRPPEKFYPRMLVSVLTATSFTGLAVRDIPSA